MEKSSALYNIIYKRDMVFFYKHYPVNQRHTMYNIYYTPGDGLLFIYFIVVVVVVYYNIYVSVFLIIKRHPVSIIKFVLNIKSHIYVLYIIIQYITYIHYYRYLYAPDRKHYQNIT